MGKNQDPKHPGSATLTCTIPILIRNKAVFTSVVPDNGLLAAASKLRPGSSGGHEGGGRAEKAFRGCQQ
jgi:hypothetical protein